MPRVKGPNGVVFDLPEVIVDALTRGEDHERVKDAPEAKSEPATKRAQPKKK